MFPLHDVCGRFRISLILILQTHIIRISTYAPSIIESLTWDVEKDENNFMQFVLIKIEFLLNDEVDSLPTSNPIIMSSIRLRILIQLKSRRQFPIYNKLESCYCSIISHHIPSRVLIFI